MNKRKTIIQGIQNVQLKHLCNILIVCFALIAFFRKDLTGRNEIFDIILGSLPNFIAVFVVCFWSYLEPPGGRPNKLCSSDCVFAKL